MKVVDVPSSSTKKAALAAKSGSLFVNGAGCGNGVRILRSRGFILIFSLGHILCGYPALCGVEVEEKGRGGGVVVEMSLCLVGVPVVCRMGEGLLVSGGGSHWCVS